MKYTSFNFARYSFDESAKQLSLEYSYDDELMFTERFTFDFDFKADYSKDALERACRLLFIMAGVSYYKAYLPAEINLGSIELTQVEAEFFSKTYHKGLGEFFYVNHLDPTTKPFFPTSENTLNTLSIESRGQLIGIGGGKDSLVTTEILRDLPNTTTWSVGHKAQLEPLIKEIALPHYSIDRQWDRKLLEHNAQGAYNGHVPISAILACVGTVVAVLTGKRDVIVSNESSTSEPNLTYNGVDINHQYSKSLEFEKDFQAILSLHFGDSIRYYSFLRPLSEVKIAELFAKLGYEKYKTVFSSCNRAYTHSSHEMFWCGECPKCAFIFLALTPFVIRKDLEKLFHGKNLLLDPTLEKTYEQLLGIEGDKPLECVGEVKESRAAMLLAQQQYVELSHFTFSLPDDYDFRTMATHSMPKELFSLLESASEPSG